MCTQETLELHTEAKRCPTCGGFLAEAVIYGQKREVCNVMGCYYGWVDEKDDDARDCAAHQQPRP